jgi:hypothetical protein
MFLTALEIAAIAGAAVGLVIQTLSLRRLQLARKHARAALLLDKAAREWSEQLRSTSPDAAFARFEEILRARVGEEDVQVIERSIKHEPVDAKVRFARKLVSTVNEQAA